MQMLDDGAVRFIKVDGSVIDSTVPNHKGEWAQLTFEHAERGVRINAQTAATRWAGERCDYGLGVQVLLGLRRKQFNPHCPSVEAHVITPSSVESNEYVPLIDEDDSLEAEDRRIERARERALRWAGKSADGDVAMIG